MSNIKLFFDRPLFLLLAIPALIVLLVPFFRLPKKRRKTFKKIAPLVLHVLMALLLVLILADTAIVRSTDAQAVVLLLDLSDSTLNVQDAIRENAQQISRLMDKNTPLGVVAFGDDCVYTLDPEEGLTPAGTDASDISGALEYAYSKLPSDKAGRIILLTDGKQTDGDADSTAQYLESQGVRLDAVYFDTAMQTAEVQIVGFSAPDSVYLGKDVGFVAEVESNTYTTGELSLYDNDTLVSTTTVDTVVGSVVLELSAPAQATGSHTYRLVYAPNRDTLPQNNEAITHVEVVEKASVLIIAGSNAQTAELEAILQRENNVTVVPSAQAPRTIPALCNYDGIVLMNASSDDLPKNYDALLDTYVSTYGRSLLAVGGDNTYMYGGMQGTAFEEMMPVSFSLSRSSEDDPVALMLVIDCSLSMSQQSTYMSVAKQGAIKCVEAMTDNDYVGIISFNRTAVVEASLDKNKDSHKDSLNRIISGLTTSQGTYYTDALKLAHEELLTSDATIKHILFVSDGSPADTSYRDLIPQIAQDGISISTVGLGYSSALLESMAESSGGQYYYVTESSDLPDIMLTLTEQISVNSLITGSFTPVVGVNSALTQGFTSLPTLNGYLGTTIKKGAEAPIVTDEGHPVFASWQYGAGTVACFTGDMSRQWCADWLDSSTGQALILGMVGSTLSEVHRDSSLLAQFTQHGKTTDISVRTVGTDNYTLTVTAGENTYPMTQIMPGLYQVSMDTNTAGVYPLTVTQTDPAGNVIDTLTTSLSVSWSAEFDAFTDGGEKLLNAMCSYSGGMVTDDLQALADIRVEAVQVVFDFMVPFGIVIFIALLADIIIRKIRWKDIKNYLLMLKHRKGR